MMMVVVVVVVVADRRSAKLLLPSHGWPPLRIAAAAALTWLVAATHSRCPHMAGRCSV